MVQVYSRCITAAVIRHNSISVHAEDDQACCQPLLYAMTATRHIHQYPKAVLGAKPKHDSGQLHTKFSNLHVSTVIDAHRG